MLGVRVLAVRPARWSEWARETGEVVGALRVGEPAAAASWGLCVRGWDEFAGERWRVCKLKCLALRKRVP